MKIIHFVTHKNGGAANAAYRISTALNRLGEESKVLTFADLLPRHSFVQRMYFRVQKMVNDKRIRSKATNFYNYNDDLSGVNFAAVKPFIEDADVIHLHWVAEGLLNFKLLEKILQTGKPIVWTLHDMHPFTGGCHYDGECGKYKKQCGQCPVLNSKKEKDFTSVNQKKKETIIKKYGQKLLVVGCSQWMTACASASRVFKNQTCMTIPNCIDTKVFKPISKEWARQILNIETDKKVIVFGAMNSTSDGRKGFTHLMEALKYLNPDEYSIAVFGGRMEELSEFEMYDLGWFSDEVSLSLVYSAGDVFVAPSVQENLANTVMEALACGTPVTAFGIGGMPDMILHEENGYLAKAYDAQELAKGIAYCCTNLKDSEAIHEDIKNRFNEELVAKRYLECYQMNLR